MSCTRWSGRQFGYYHHYCDSTIYYTGILSSLTECSFHYCIICHPSCIPYGYILVSSRQSWFHCMHTKWVCQLALSHSEENKWTIMMESKLSKPHWPSICKVRRSITFPAPQLLYILCTYTILKFTFSVHAVIPELHYDFMWNDPSTQSTPQSSDREGLAHVDRRFSVRINTVQYVWTSSSPLFISCGLLAKEWVDVSPLGCFLGPGNSDRTESFKWRLKKYHVVLWYVRSTVKKKQNIYSFNNSNSIEKINEQSACLELTALTKY